MTQFQLIYDFSTPDFAPRTAHEIESFFRETESRKELVDRIRSCEPYNKRGQLNPGFDHMSSDELENLDKRFEDLFEKIEMHSTSIFEMKMFASGRKQVEDFMDGDLDALRSFQFTYVDDLPLGNLYRMIKVKEENRFHEDVVTASKEAQAHKSMMRDYTRLPAKYIVGEHLSEMNTERIEKLNKLRSTLLEHPPTWPEMKLYIPSISSEMWEEIDYLTMGVDSE